MAPFKGYDGGEYLKKGASPPRGAQGLGCLLDRHAAGSWSNRRELSFSIAALRVPAPNSGTQRLRLERLFMPLSGRCLTTPTCESQEGGEQLFPPNALVGNAGALVAEIEAGAQPITLNTVVSAILERERGSPAR